MNAKERADRLFHQAYALQMKGCLDLAIELYSRSIEIFPTAEAFTFRGWSYSFQGDLARAIEECLQAIEVDPDYGNPYNDIGAYLIEQNRLDEAVEWLQRAVRAPRYAQRCFAFFNLGRVHELKLRLREAEAWYQRAAAADHAYIPAKRALRRLRAHWN